MALDMWATHKTDIGVVPRSLYVSVCGVYVVCVCVVCWLSICIQYRSQVQVAVRAGVELWSWRGITRLICYSLVFTLDNCGRDGVGAGGHPIGVGRQVGTQVTATSNQHHHHHRHHQHALPLCGLSSVWAVSLPRLGFISSGNDRMSKFFLITEFQRFLLLLLKETTEKATAESVLNC